MQLSLNIEEFYLPNGLRVILHQDRSTPIVAVNLWYHVGSKNEQRGRTGFAHLFEHLMFEGSKHHDTEYFAPLQEAGANVNGSTNADRTNYYEVVPSNFLELALWLEADRMGYLLDAMTLEKLDNQRDVVKNEKRQRYDNVPFGRVGEQIAELMYPPEHPYNWLTIGSMEDLEAASLDDVQDFFRRFYVPNNASLVLAGDFELNEARKLIEKYFAPIPRGREVERPTSPAPRLEKEIRESMNDAVALPRIYFVWHTVAEFAPDEAALDFLASILSSGRGARLQQNLVFGKQISQDVSASHFCREIAGQFQITSTAKPNVALAEIEREILAEIERIKNELPTAEEMIRALNARDSGYIYALQTVLGKADALNAYATFQNEPNFFAQDLERYRQVTASDVQNAARKYLIENRLVLTVTPAAKITSQIDAPDSKHGGAKHKKEIVDTEKLGGLYIPPAPSATPNFVLPEIERHFLSNGLEILLVRRDKLPILSLNLVFKTGGTANSLEKFGAAAMTADLLRQGTETRTAIEISNELQKIGANLGTGASWDSSSLSLLTLTTNADAALEIFADVALNPIFPETELETHRARLLAAFLQQRDNANAIAAKSFNQILYGKNHSYGKQLSGDETTVAAMQQADLQNFYSTFYRPNNAVLIAVGDVKTADFLAQMENIFGAWTTGEIPATVLHDAPNRETSEIFIVDKPAAAQSIINIGQIGVPRNSPHYFALTLMNQVLGGQFTSRVNMNLREEKGFTYGARTGFDWRRGAAPFAASASVQTAVTKEAVIEFLRELNDIRTVRPVTEKELEYNKQSLIRRYPSNFETAGQIAGQLAGITIYDLPDSYFNDYIKNVNAVSIQDANRAAAEHLEPAKMAIVIVGDQKSIEPSLREIHGATTHFLNI